MDTGLFEWRDLVDIGLSTLLLYALLACARSARSVLTLVALGVLAASHAVARAYGYPLMAQILLVVFLGGCAYGVLMTHDDLRRWLDRAAGMASSRSARGTATTVETIVSAVERMAHARTGALLVLPGAQPLGPDVHGGVTLDAELSVPLLLSLFDATSPGHDGALVVRDGRAAEFAVHLPLSTNEAALGERGTRHAAALGLSEQTDALCVLVSEERGIVSIARRSELCSVDAGVLAEHLHAHLVGNTLPSTAPRRRRGWLHVAHFGIAALAAVAGWVATVQGGREVTRSVDVPVTLEGMPEGFEMIGSTPSTVRVTVSGPRGELLLLSDREVELAIDGWAVKHGRRTFFVNPRNVRAGGADIDVRGVEPRRVEVQVAATGEIATTGE